jgi:hypothetical protein
MANSYVNYVNWCQSVIGRSSRTDRFPGTLRFPRLRVGPLRSDVKSDYYMEMDTIAIAPRCQGQSREDYSFRASGKTLIQLGTRAIGEQLQGHGGPVEHAQNPTTS